MIIKTNKQQTIENAAALVKTFKIVDETAEKFHTLGLITGFIFGVVCCLIIYTKTKGE